MGRVGLVRLVTVIPGGILHPTALNVSTEMVRVGWQDNSTPYSYDFAQFGLHWFK